MRLFKRFGHRVCLLGLLVLVACGGTETNGEDPEPGAPAAPLTVDEAELKRLLLRYPDSSDDEWAVIRQQIVDQGVVGQGQMTLFFCAIFLKGADNDLLRRTYGEFVWLMGVSENMGTHMLIPTLYKGSSTTRPWVIRVLARCRDGAVNVEGEKVPVKQAVLDEYRRQTDLGRRLRLLEALVEMKVDDQPLALSELYEAARTAGDWQPRAELMEAIARLDTDESLTVLQAGIQDPDPNVRLIAKGSLKRLNRIRRAKKRDS